MKLKRYSRVRFKCPSCGNETPYALRVADAPSGNTYWCEVCKTESNLKNRTALGILYGVVLGAAMAALLYWPYTKYLLNYPPVLIILSATPIGFALSWVLFPSFTKLFYRWVPGNR